MIQERLKKLRQEMQKENVQAYIIPTSDFHETEYVCDYFACRKYMSGFTGSAGTLVVLTDRAALWTDGRYFIQAASQLQGTTIKLMKMGLEETPSIEEYIVEHLSLEDTVGFDGRVINTKDARSYQHAFGYHHLKMKTDIDLVGRIWKDRPALPSTPTFHYDETHAGLSIKEKLTLVREAMDAHHAYSHIITKIDEVAWLLNLRANDIPYFPVALAYMTITMDTAAVYLDASRLDEKSRGLFKKNNIDIKAYNAIYEDVNSLQGPILLDPSSVNLRIYESIHEDIVEAQDPIILLKAVKNETEIENTKWAHIKDGVAVTKFMYWLKKHINDGNITEMSAQEQLHQFRAEQPNYLEDSFATIAAYKEHGAIIHYQSSPETDIPLQSEGMLMVDSGGQYLEGTTDITRTFVLGPISKEERKWFTLVLAGHIRLEMAHWLYGCRGINLDILARGPLWDRNMDFQHGTGHGVGHLSSVHEAPNGIRWKMVPERLDSAILEPGMITSDEPGVYIENHFGIRHENEVLAVLGEKNEYGQFMHFEPLTFVPFDVDGMDVSLLQENEILWLNAYHQDVYEKISPYLEKEESEWLKEICQPIHK